MRLPTINPNGTKAERLLEQYEHAQQSVNLALSALKEASPNARDYAAQGKNAETEAAAEHQVRVNKISTVEQELKAIIESIRSQVVAS